MQAFRPFSVISYDTIDFDNRIIAYIQALSAVIAKFIRIKVTYLAFQTPYAIAVI